MMKFNKYNVDEVKQGRCIKCKEIKNRDEFYKVKSKRGITSSCKKCHIAITKARGKTDKEKAKTAIKIICICGGRYTRTHKRQHIDSIKHQIYISV